MSRPSIGLCTLLAPGHSGLGEKFTNKMLVPNVTAAISSNSNDSTVIIQCHFETV